MGLHRTIGCAQWREGGKDRIRLSQDGIRNFERSIPTIFYHTHPCFLKISWEFYAVKDFFLNFF
jgi:hypothetical protein